MPYLVDGNNVMAQRVGWHRDKPGARRALLDELSGFVQARKVKVSVVFDGAPEQHFADGAAYRGIRVFYAERGSDADERIKRMVDAARERRTLFVITSDRALAAYVRRCGAQVIPSGEFRQRMQEALATETAKEDDRASVFGEDVNKWMRYFGVGEEDDEGSDE
jgi:predicted RNA-binding protein with PIN domain